jgi:eukaryotic-like serine/threonine-protein kinase
MKPERWQQAREVLADALELKPEDRPAFLDRACSSDHELRREVERLLSSSDEARSSFLQSSGLRIGLTPGAKLGDYEVQRLIGSGGMGEVYRARDTRLGRDVAIKVLPSFVSHDPDRLRRFDQEARAAAALNHPNILAVFQMGTYEGAPYLVSELLEGSTLREQLVRGPLPLRKAIDYGIQIARGLAAAHEKGIAHRDLKPENLFVTKDGWVKILDFGLAKLVQRPTTLDHSRVTVSEGTEPGVVMGTVGYMSPEQVCGKDADHRADIFAFGAILYEILARKRAFQKPTSAETMSAILNEDPPGISQLAPSVPLALQRVVHRCLEKNPERRFQSASDLAFALEALSDSGGLLPAAVDTQRPSRARSARIRWASAALILLLAAFGIFRLVNAPHIPVDPSRWVQITNLPDSVTQPALSPDGRMLTFVRGPYTFTSPGQIYVKMLAGGEPVQLTWDNSQKMNPAFSPDGSRIAYTTVDGKMHWDTWVVPVLGGQPRLWLPNASGLVWLDKEKILFSEIKNNDMHMAIVSAGESRAAEHDVYVPPADRGMAHRSSPSPNGKWALVVEMDRGLWLPCKLVSLDGSSPTRPVGPAAAACTSATWSADGNWMYFTSGASGMFHIWRQRFSNGRPEQITSGPSEEEGIAMAPGGLSLITAVGSRQSSVWIHDSNGKRQVSLEGFSYDPKLTPDGKRLCYRILKGASLSNDASELRVVELDTMREETFLPGFAVVGIPGRTYDISPDGRQVVVTALDREGKHRLWLAPFDNRLPPRQISNVEGDDPQFGPGDEILFRASERNSAFAYRVREDGSGLERVINQPIATLYSISPDGQWLVVKLPGTEGSSTTAFRLREGPLFRLVSGGISFGDVEVRWSGDSRAIYVRIPEAAEEGSRARTYVVPLPRGRVWPEIPAGGLRSEVEIAKLPGASLLDEFEMPGPTPEIYTFVRMTTQRNLFRVPLP